VIVVFRYSALFHAFSLIFKFSCSFCHLHDAYIINVSQTDGITNVVPKFSVSSEYCTGLHNVKTVA